MDEQSYLIRYGVMSHVGRFSAQPIRDSRLERGQLVVLQTDRGVELGEVLIAVDGQSPLARHELDNTAARSNLENSDPGADVHAPRVLRVAGPEDLSRSKHAEESRPSRFSLCERILREGNWPWELIDVEPLLDGRSTVIHYLGPHQIDMASLRARFRVECDIDVVLEPVGSDLESEALDDGAQIESSSGGCGSCGCTDGGGCGTAAIEESAPHDHPAEPAAGGCAPKSHSGCSSCGISRLLAERKRALA